MIEMTIQPTATTLFEVIDRETYRTIGYFEKGDDARTYAAVIPNAYTMIYLKPTAEKKETPAMTPTERFDAFMQTVDLQNVMLVPVADDAELLKETEQWERDGWRVTGRNTDWRHLVNPNRYGFVKIHTA